MDVDQWFAFKFFFFYWIPEVRYGQMLHWLGPMACVFLLDCRGKIQTMLNSSADKIARIFLQDCRSKIKKKKKSHSDVGQRRESFD